ncbi:MAG TPA: tRNA (adenosine(37)-N6)-dimethylallyltransferase MiaA [Thermodesulfovibrionales bacterium]|nr:tRNA (adenosine(37)-N6)-dimethylallyltransferase MiaA [Thermodesulfovibrionales bacterium]
MKTVIILLGPTGVGKTGASITLAKEMNTEIISADSMQIYRHMDIGTAKPSKEQRLSVRHYMIDIVEPSEAYSTGRYIAEAVPVIERMHREGKIPVVVGGTGLYIRAMTRGLFSGPSSDAELRRSLLAREGEQEGSLYAYLRQIDPAAAGRLDRNDIRRIIRAIEVCMKSGSTISSSQQERTQPLPYDFIKIGLTRERSELYTMIDGRVDDMLARGLLDEVRLVLSMNPDRTPLQAIGYKEFVRFLGHEIDLPEAVRLIKRNSRRYAKRQFTWFRQETDILWVDVTGLHDSRSIAGKIRAALRDVPGLRQIPLNN